MSDMRVRLDRLLEKARGLPKVPGVYLMKDAQGRVIYVGKAVCLPDRVSSYFVPSADLGPRKQRMLDVVDDLDTLECESEWEALLAENRLIKDLHPKFNVRLTDGKSFPYLAVTLKDDFPGVYITRQPQDVRFAGAKIFGPFTGVDALRQSLQVLQRIFRFRSCEMDILDHDQKRRFFRPCLLYPIHQCTGPCAAKISREDYRSDIDRLLRFMQSKRTAVIAELTQQMHAAADQRQYEKAAGLRDQIQAIRRLDERGEKRDQWQPEVESFIRNPADGLAALQRVLEMDKPIRCIECIDIAHLQGNETVGSKVCFIDGRPFKDEYRRYRIRQAANDDYTSIREVVSRRYRDAGQGQELYPELVIIDGGLGQLHAAMEVFDSLTIKPPMVVALAKKEELIYVQNRSEPIRLPKHHPGLQICQAIRDEAHRFAQHYHHLLRQKRQLGEKQSQALQKLEDGIKRDRDQESRREEK